MNIQLQNLKVKEVKLFLSISFLLGSQSDSTGIFIGDSGKSVSKFSDGMWFLLFEDLCNGEEYLQVNKTSKKHWN